MHLKSIGAICARTLSYEDCEFALVENASDKNAREVYNSSAELWGDLFVKLGERCADLRAGDKLEKRIRDLVDKGQELPEELLFYQNVHDISDDDDSDDEDGICEQRKLRRKFRDRKSKTLRGLFWSAHQVCLSTNPASTPLVDHDVTPPYIFASEILSISLYCLQGQQGH